MKDYQTLYYEARLKYHEALLKIEDLEDEIQGFVEAKENYFKKYKDLKGLLERQGVYLR